ncbi:hypothetical protein BGY98DRAFT_1102004 [Russula aff. rugulosa BPL654]|nr:hypothetical protein BGY98DRAFT_1102004 [Russula aff. rugulosa BPL654]
MQCPLTPRPVVLVFVEPSSGGQSYVPVSPADSKGSPRQGGIPATPTDPAINQPPSTWSKLQHGSSLPPLQYPCQTASPRLPHKSSASIADNGGTTVSNAIPPMYAAPRAAVVSPPARTQILVASAQPGTDPAGAAEALRAGLQGFCSPTTRMWGSPSLKTTSIMAVSSTTPMSPLETASSFAPTLQSRHAPPHIGTASNYRLPPLPSRPRQATPTGPLSSHGSASTTPQFLQNGEEEKDWSMEAWKSPSTVGVMLRPPEDREELDRLLHTNDVISMHLLSIEFDSELLLISACSIWLHSVTRLKYAIDSDIF